MLDSNKLNNAKLGGRVECLGFHGTIKYIGVVDGHDGYWLGIDWDDTDRGKHNGTVKGKTYFVASAETSGSFVRPEKVNLGQSIITGIKSRYGGENDDITAKCIQQQLLSFQQSMKAPLLEMVGFDKVASIQSNFHDLKIVNVGVCNISSAGEESELHNLCPNITELDLANNLIHSWSVIFQIIQQLEYLKVLTVRENRLSIPSDIENYNFPNVQTLICGKCALNWDDLLRLCNVFPNLEVLIAPDNLITHLNLAEGQLRKLKIIDLVGNSIKDWQEVCKLGQLEFLHTLNLETTGIREIRFEEENKTSLFKNLATLVIRDNLIEDWESIGELDKLKSLINLKSSKNPLFTDKSVACSTQFTIARIANLQILNGSDIQDQRKGAEIDYLKVNGLEWLAVKGDPERRAKFLDKHRRYLELIKKHGESEEAELKVQVKTIQGSLIEVNLIHEDRVIPKKLPPTLLIQKLIMLVQRLFHLDERPTLVYISKEDPDIEIDLDDECKELGIYSVQNGDRILVKT